MGTISNIRNLQDCGKELKEVRTYDQAIQIMERYNLRLAEYGDYKPDGSQGYVFYNHDGDRHSDIGIYMVYSWKKDEACKKRLLADQIVKLDIYF